MSRHKSNQFTPPQRSLDLGAHEILVVIGNLREQTLDSSGVELITRS